jgi:hypothetical protein
MKLYRYHLVVACREGFFIGTGEKVSDRPIGAIKTNVTAESAEQARRTAVHRANDAGLIAVEVLIAKRRLLGFDYYGDNHDA